MTTFPALAPYQDRGALLSLLQQDLLDTTATTALGSFRWEVDTPSRTLSFISEQDPSRRLVTRTHLLASIAPGPRSLLWAWAHPQGDGDQSITVRLRERGQQDGVRELTEAEVPFPEGFNADDPQAIADLSHEIATAAVGILGVGPYYSAPVEGGTRFLFLLESPELPPVTLNQALIATPRMLSTGLLRDARTSVWGLATLRGWNFQWTAPDYSSATISDGVTTAQFTFDQAGRVTGINGSLAS